MSILGNSDMKLSLIRDGAQARIRYLDLTLRTPRVATCNTFCWGYKLTKRLPYAC